MFPQRAWVEVPRLFWSKKPTNVGPLVIQKVDTIHVREGYAGVIKEMDVLYSLYISE